MKKFLKNIGYFILPFLIYYLLIYFIDPFNYYGKNVEINRINNIAKNTEPHLYKIIDFKHNPKNNILLGDSRTNSLYRIFEENRLNTWSNLAYGGGSLNEVVETFWHITKTNKIDSVLIGINFNHFNKNNSRNWIKPTLSLIENSISYSFSKYVFLSISEFIQTFDNEKVTKSKESKNIFWNNHLNMINNKFYKNVIFPYNYINDLDNISIFCRSNNIELIFWIPPVHQDIHDLIKINGFLKDYNKFINEIEKLGTMYNFDNDFKLRTEKSNFNDAMHLNSLNMQNIYSKIFNVSE